MIGDDSFSKKKYFIWYMSFEKNYLKNHVVSLGKWDFPNTSDP